MKLHAWNLTEIRRTIRRSFEAAYDMKRKNEGQDIPYDGPLLRTVRIIAGGLNINENLSAECVEEKEGEDRRDALNQLILITFQLGIEQGYRILMDDNICQDLNLKDIERTLDKYEGVSDSPDELDDEAIETARQAVASLRKHIEDPGKIKRRSTT